MVFLWKRYAHPDQCQFEKKIKHPVRLINVRWFFYDMKRNAKLSIKSS